ncbi:unnamed protein product [Symbiodinium sp. CCMP2592]|nr:unnamed protein product [Symbiodinium sp. CCMP2592]
MPGYLCRMDGCGQHTFRKPPNNECEACRPVSKRGANRRWPKIRFREKCAVSPGGVPDRTTVRAAARPNQKRNAAVIEAESASDQQSPREEEQTGSQQPEPALPPPRQRQLQPNDYDGHETALNEMFQEIQQIVGSASAHNALGCAQAMVKRFARAAASIPSDLTTIVAVSFALRGDENNEAMRIAWYEHCGRLSIYARKAHESRLIMALPFQTDLQEDMSLTDMSRVT